MDDQSMWKKEISFKRKPKEPKAPKEAKASKVPDTPAEEPTSLWKKDLSFRRKPKQKTEGEVELAPVSDGQGQGSDPETGPNESVWKKEIKRAPEPEPAQVEVEAQASEAARTDSSVSDSPVPVPDTETGSKESVWKKEIKRAPKPEPAQLEVEAQASEAARTDTLPSDRPLPVPDAETSSNEPAVASGAVEVSDTETGPKESVWKKEIKRAPKPKPAQVEVEAQASEPALTDTPGSDSPETSVWKKEVSFGRKPSPEQQAVEAETGPAEIVASDPVVAADPVAAEPTAEESAVGELVVTEDPAAARRASLVESWSASPQAPPVHLDAPPLSVPDAPTAEIPAAETSPAPPTVVHPPVPAAELPPLKAEKVVPFWKKDISFGGKTKEPKQPKEPKEQKERRGKQPKAPKMKVDKGSKGSKRLVGLKIGASQLAAARVANNGSAELLQVAREPLNPGIVVGGELRDPDALSEALKDFFAKHKLPKRGVRLGIANNRIGVRTFEIVGIQDQKQLANAIRFRAQEVLPIPIDEAVLDYQILDEGVNEEGQPTRRVLLVVAYRELIDRYVDACKKAGVVLNGIDLESFALLRALQAPQEGAGDDPSAALVAVAIGHERSTFAVSDGRICEFTRVLEWGGSALNVAIARALDAAPSEVEGVKHSLTLTDGPLPDGLTADQAKKAVDAVRKAIQTFVRELVSSLQYYQNQPGSLGIGEIVLSGGTAHLPGLAAELEGLIGVRVRVGDPLARMKVSKKVGDPDQIGSLAVAIGLGIED
jgi:type IV pilus assembly protein PilM